MARILVQEEGVYTSWGIDLGYLGYTLEINGNDIARLVRDALKLTHENVTEKANLRFFVTVGWLNDEVE